jgi:hypothetical protein
MLVFTDVVGMQIHTLVARNKILAEIIYPEDSCQSGKRLLS